MTPNDIAEAITPQVRQSVETLPETTGPVVARGAALDLLGTVVHKAVPLVLGQLEDAFGPALKDLVGRARSGVHLVLHDRDIAFLESLLDTLKTGE